MIKNQSESFIKKIRTLNKIYSVSPKEINALTERRKCDSIELLPSKYISLNEYKTSFKNMCTDFFLVSLPSHNNNNEQLFLKSSYKYTSQCKHTLCSKLLSIKPSIISHLSNINSPLKLNDSTAHLCFPTGIKICLEQNIFNIPTPKNIFTFITNSDGTRLYIMMYYFYNKIPKQTFITKYNNNSISQYISSMKQTLSTSYMLTTKEALSHLYKEIETCSEIEYTEYINIPICACLISKYPYKAQMEYILNTFIKLYSDISRPLSEAITFMEYILYSIPFPYKNDSSLSFYIPLKKQPIVIKTHHKENSFRYFNDLYILIEILSIDVIIKLFTYIILEKRIILIDNDNYKLTFIINCFLELIYPLQWIGILIPLICDDMIDYISSFLPFICGMNKELYMAYKEYVHKEVDEQAIFVYLERGEIKNRMKCKIKNDIGLPKEYEEMLKGGLKFIKKNMKKYPIEEKRVFNKSVRDLFWEVMKEIVMKKKNFYGEFYTLLKGTQLYEQFRGYEWKDEDIQEKEEKRYGVLPYFMKRRKEWNTFGEVVDYVERNFVEIRKRNEKNGTDVLDEYERVLVDCEELVFDEKMNGKGVEVFEI